MRRYVGVVVEWMEHGDVLRLWGQVFFGGARAQKGEKNEEQGMKKEDLETVYVRSDLDELWPGIGREMGLIMNVLEEFGKGVWG